MASPDSPSVVWRQAVPAVGWWLSLLGFTAGVDLLLHRLGWGGVGRWLGVPGVGLLALSFLYSLKKRRLLSCGTPQGLLRLHEALGWVATLLVLVHAGIHFHALLPWLAMASMVVVVASGLTGSVLLKGALAQLRARGPAAPSVLDAALVGAMKRWRAVHLPLNAVFLVLALWHVGAALLLRAR